MLLRVTLSFVLFFFYSFGLKSQFNEYNIRPLNKEGGLEKNFIYAIGQADNGLMYFSTNSGLFSSDNIKPEQCNIEDSEIITDICSYDNELLLATQKGGIIRYPSRDTVRQYDYSKVDQLKIFNQAVYFVNKLTELKKITETGNEKSLFISETPLVNYAFVGNQIYLADNKKLFRIDLENSLLDTVRIEDQININACIKADENSLVLITDSNRVYNYHVLENKLTFIDQLEGNNIDISALYINTNDALWIGTYNGEVFKLNLKGTMNHDYTYFSPKEFSNGSINQFFEDDESNMWIATLGGGGFQLVHTVFGYNQLDSRPIGFCKVKDKTILATQKKLLEIEWNGKSIATKTELISFDFDASGMCNLNNDEVLLGTVNGVYRFNINNKRLMAVPNLDGYVKGIKKINDKIVISILNRGCFVLDQNLNVLKNYSLYTGFAGNNIDFFSVDNTEDIWLNVQNNGLFKTQKSDVINLSDKFDLPLVTINDILHYNDNETWIATDGLGILIYDKEEDKFKKLDKKQGLLSNYPTGLNLRNGVLWIAYRDGVQRKNKKMNFINFDNINHAVVSSSLKSAFVDVDNRSLIMSNMGVKVINHELDSIEHKVRPPFFKSILCSNKPIEYKADSTYIFSYNENSFSFDFVSVFLKSRKVYYRYKMLGTDNDWKYIDNVPEVNYLNLSDGDYTFIVEASKEPFFDNSLPLKFKFQVKKPYWEKYWFYLLQIFVLIAFILLFYFVSREVKNRYVIGISIFVTIYLIFEFVHEMAEPYFISHAERIPLLKVFLNLIIAVLLYPLENILRKLLNKKSNEV